MKPDNTWIPWKGLKLAGCSGTIRRSRLPTTLEFPERDWNIHRKENRTFKKNSPTTLEFPERDWNMLPATLSNAGETDPDNTWIPWKGLKHLRMRQLQRKTSARQHLNSLKGIETAAAMGYAMSADLSPTTLEFPERDWNRHGCRLKMWPGLPDNTWIPWKGLKLQGKKAKHSRLRNRQHLNSLKGIETSPISGTIHSQPFARQHLNSLKGIETLRLPYRSPPNGFPTTLEFPERDWNLSRLRFLRMCPTCPTTLEFPERDWNLPFPLWVCLRHLPDNTWIPWKGLKPPAQRTPRWCLSGPTTLEFPERDWNKIWVWIIMTELWIPTTLEFPERDWNFGKNIRLNLLHRLADNTWIPWKGLKPWPRGTRSPRLCRQHLNSLKGIETSMVWESATGFCFTDNTWIPWKGLKREHIRRSKWFPKPDNTWIPWKGLKHLRMRQLQRKTSGPTTLEFPERDWNSGFPAAFYRWSHDADNTWIPWKGLKLFRLRFIGIMLLISRQHLNSLKGIETPGFGGFQPGRFNSRQHLNSLKGIETFFRCYFRYSAISRQHLNSLKGIETCNGGMFWTLHCVPDNTWIPWKGLKPKAQNRSAWPAALRSDNTWIPWKGLKQLTRT